LRVRFRWLADVVLGRRRYPLRILGSAGGRRRSPARLSPALNPDPCAPGEAMRNFRNMAIFKPVSASASYDLLHAPEYAVDLSMRSQWAAAPTRRSGSRWTCSRPQASAESDFQWFSTTSDIRAPRPGKRRERRLSGVARVQRQHPGWSDTRVHAAAAMAGNPLGARGDAGGPSWVAWGEIEILRP